MASKFRRQPKPGPSRIVTQTTNPLMLPDTLTHILEFCPFETLKYARQVSRMWLECSQEAWQSSRKVTLVPNGKGSTYMEQIKALKKIKRKNPDGLPINYCLKASLRPNLQFWKIFGDHMDSLELKAPHLHMHEVLEVINENCPNIQHLTLLFTTSRGQAREVTEPTKWEEPRFGVNRIRTLKIKCELGRIGISRLELLSHFPCLQALTVVHRLVRCKCSIDKWTRAVEIIRKQDPGFFKGGKGVINFARKNRRNDK